MALLAKATSTFTNLVKRMRGFLLKEDGDYLLLENGYKIIIEPDASQWDGLTKHSSSF